MFKMEFFTDNDAFQDGRLANQVAHLLRDVANRVTEGNQDGPVIDVNGATVGRWSLTAD